MPGTTPVYGFPYPEPTDLVADYPSLGQQLAEDIEAVLPGLGALAKTTPTSITHSGGSASLTGNTVTLTGVSSVSLNGVFNANYVHYRIALNLIGSTTGAVALRLRVSGTDATTSYSGLLLQVTSGSVVTGGLATDNFQLTDVTTSYDSASFIDMSRPFLTQPTAALGTMSRYNLYRTFSALHNVSTSYTGFTIYPASGTLTGTVSVYGYTL